VHGHRKHFRPISSIANGGEVYNILEAMYVDRTQRSGGWEQEFVEQLNDVFSQESIGWKMDPGGRLQRLLPEAIKVEAEGVFGELQIPRFAPAEV
jgi:hypothetical protein